MTAQDLSYHQLKASNDARLGEELRSEQRKRNTLLLILHYLHEEGYTSSATTLESEVGVSLLKFEICDNIDLQTIIQEYESYYFVKFNKWPRISKRCNATDGNERNKSSKLPGKQPSRRPPKAKSFSLPHIASISAHSDSEVHLNNSPNDRMKKKYEKQKEENNRKNKQEETKKKEETALEADSLSLQGVSSLTIPKSKKEPPAKKAIVDYKAILSNTLQSEYQETSERLLKPLGGYSGLTGELKELAAIISKDIYLENPDVRWKDIIGLDEAKRLVKESVVYPIKYPQLFNGILSPWKGLLLYGPPGTGKTLLAKAVATECNTTFFNISASTIVSKWRGDSEKLVRVLFELARFHAPSTIFLDELDSLMGQRGVSNASGEHEGSRRMKTELLMQMDGLSKTDDLVFLLAASNLPWELDRAMLRRLEKRILVGLPTEEARVKMLEHFLPEQQKPVGNQVQVNSKIDYEEIARKTVGYSGSDIRLVCKEAAMRPVRKIFAILENHNTGDSLPEFHVDPVVTSDVTCALERTKPSASNLLERYERWKQEFGAG